jgi:acetolactate synthase-1/2/3 large subunit
VIALSEEMQKDMVDVPDLGPALVSRPQPDPDAITALGQLLANAKKPLAIVGGSGWTETGRAAIHRFLVAHDLPVAVSFRRQGHYDGTLANFGGDLGVGPDPALVARAKEADLILAIGTRLGEAVTQGYTLFDPAGGTTIVHVHQEASEIGRVFRPRLGIASDLNAFATAAAALPPGKTGWGEWTAELRAIRQAGRVPVETAFPLNVGAVMRALEDLLAPDAVCTCDAGNFAGWPQRFIDFGPGQRFLGPTNGAMGYSVPAAIGAKVAFPDRMVVSFVGDGGFMMTGQEIATAFHHGVAPIVIVFNNSMYGTIRMYQERSYPGRVSGTALTNPDFARLIEAYGGHGETVKETAEFAPAFQRAVQSGKPAVIELVMDPEQITSRATVAQLRAGTGVVKPAAKPAPASKVDRPATARPRAKR